MPSYKVISHAEDDVVGALQREGGELSYPELVSTTQLSHDVIADVLEQLKDKNRVEIRTMGDDQSGIRLARLRYGPFKTLFNFS